MENKTPEDEILNETNSTVEQTPETEEDKAAEYYDMLQRTIADFDNFRKRTIKEKASMYDDGVRDTVEKILPILDNFERALSSVQNKDDVFYKGVEMILRQFEGALDYIGVEKIEAAGAKFNPNLHNAVAHIEDENFSESEITEEMQKGYIYKDKVIRHSMVKVAN